MNISDETSNNMYGISRIDCEKYHTHAWKVSLSRHGKRHVKKFPDKKCGGKDKALHNAFQFRDQLLLKYPPITRRDYCDTMRRNNKTGITGVYKYVKSYRLKDGTLKHSWYWEANWPDAEGISVCKAFSVKRYGEEFAKQMAINARGKGLQTIKGTFWAAQRGDLQACSNTTATQRLATTTALTA